MKRNIKLRHGQRRRIDEAHKSVVDNVLKHYVGYGHYRRTDFVDAFEEIGEGIIRNHYFAAGLGNYLSWIAVKELKKALYNGYNPIAVNRQFSKPRNSPTVMRCA